MQRGNSVKRVNSAICPSRLGWSSASASISQSKAGLQAIVQGWCLICLICLSSMLSQIVDWLVHKPFSVEGQMIAISLVFPFASQTRKAWSKEQMAFIKVTSAPCIGQRQPPQGNNHLNSAKPCSPPDMVQYVRSTAGFMCLLKLLLFQQWGERRRLPSISQQDTLTSKMSNCSKILLVQVGWTYRQNERPQEFSWGDMPLVSWLFLFPQ